MTNIIAWLKKPALCHSHMALLRGPAFPSLQGNYVVIVRPQSS
ncbi:hypothetical protein RFEPED_1520 [Rickettsia felis str. Pedreira]|uniref:Uncharacterized protein n=1 Tax=Rickettsia felis str. Pedreira TaxID=1359196 RepID=A0A0F3MTR7_RICFI|nr:hypothetical protein RFEPED_1520 [Rickettsia felis str. Pedreira]